MAIDLTDYSQNSNTLTNVNAAVESNDLPFSSENVSSALLNGSSQYFSAVDSASLSMTGSFTLETWVNFAAVPSGGSTVVFFSKWDDANKLSYIFQLTDAAGLKLQLVTSADGTNIDNNVTVTWTPSTSTWYHASVVREKGVGIRFYVNAVIQGAQQADDNSAVYDSDHGVGFGAKHKGTPGNFISGKIDDGRVWNDDRTVAELLANFNKRLLGTETGLQAYWPLDDGIVAAGGRPMFFSGGVAVG